MAGVLNVLIGGGPLKLTYVGGNTAYNSSTGTFPSASLTALTGGVSTSARSYDLVIACGACLGTTAPSGMNEAGYTQMGSAVNGSSVSLSCFWKIMGATPDTTASIIGGTATTYRAMAVHVWRFSSQSTPIDVTPTTASSSTSIDCPSITPVSPGAVILAIGAASYGSGGSVTTVPSGMTNLTTITSPSAALSVSIASYSGWKSGAYDPAAFGTSVSVADAQMMTSALRSG